MKKLLTFLSFITLFSTFSYSQISQDLSYQSIVRYANGNLVVSTDVEVDLAITSNGATVYSESHTATTSKNGLVSLRLGSKNISDHHFHSFQNFDLNKKTLYLFFHH